MEFYRIQMLTHCIIYTYTMIRRPAEINIKNNIEQVRGTTKIYVALKDTWLDVMNTIGTYQAKISATS